uniref:Variabilin n=1 Tax=Dermacentor variabilis TaxID=34621 RepID=VARIA_DERVA|nr:RecName: Full=Variabilin; AltName: Full=Anti-platelet agent; AltName: Full=Platelet aggregation inhibitor; Short=PAI [Dermacentor variabilis]
NTFSDENPGFPCDCTSADAKRACGIQCACWPRGDTPGGGRRIIDGQQ